MTGPDRSGTLALAIARMTLLAVLLDGCSSWQPPSGDAVAPLRVRAASSEKQGVVVRAAVLSADDRERMFGMEIDAATVQPVWIEIENSTAQPLVLLRTGTDPDYFSPLEIAWSLHTWLDRKTNARIDQWFNQQGFHNPIPSQSVRSGIVFTNPARGTKLLNVDLLGDRSLYAFTMFLGVPDDAKHADFSRPLFAYPASAVTDYSDPGALRAALERLPCCATDANGRPGGDPLNGVAVGGLEDFGAAMVRRNYRRNQHASDNAQYVFGRTPDAVLRKQAQAGTPATWIRAWRAPVSYRGRPVYLLQIGRPVGGRFASGSETPSLHEDVDEARNLMIQDSMYSQGLEKLAFVKGAADGSGSAPRTRQGLAQGGARYFTDGLRAVMFFVIRPLSLSDIEILDWEPYLDRRVVPDVAGASDVSP